MEGVHMDDRTQVSSALRRIVAAGMSGELGDLVDILHDNVVMVFPGFGDRAQGKTAMMSGFEDFTQNATVCEHDELDEQVDVVGEVAIGSYRFNVKYSRNGALYQSTGRDMWVFRNQEGRWQAVWRTILELVDQRLDG